MTFDESMTDMPRHFAGNGDLISSHVIAALSAVFPDGEDFFVRSVRHFRDQITDPDLKRQVAGFIGQEAVHGREHRMLNEHFDRLGYPTKKVEPVIRWALAGRERLLPATSNLAATAALEHFTATIAEIILTDPAARQQIGHRGVRDLFVWHALEESEHKAVAFDVYRAVGGSERMRVVTMNIIRYGFVVTMSLQVALSLLLDPAAYRPVRLWRSLRAFRTSPLVGLKVWRRLRDYNRRDFHPDDYDNVELIQHWRAELFGARGTLVDRLSA
jgi:hypothetical protein